MTDPTAPLSDEDLSAVLDGEAPPDVEARLAADPAGQARLAELRAAAAAVAAASVTPLPSDTVDELVTAALAADPAEAGAAHGDDPAAEDRSEAVVAPMRGRRSPPPGWLVAAVIVALVAAGLGLVWSGTHRSTSSDQSVPKTDVATDGALDSSARQPAPSQSGGASGSASATTTSRSSTVQPDATATAGGGPDVLGSYPNAAGLRTALARAWPTDATFQSKETADTATLRAAAAVTPASVARCAGQVAITLHLSGAPSHRGLAAVGDLTALVYEFPAKASPDRRATIVAVGVAACEPIVIFER